MMKRALVSKSTNHLWATYSTVSYLQRKYFNIMDTSSTQHLGIQLPDDSCKFFSLLLNILLKQKCRSATYNANLYKHDQCHTLHVIIIIITLEHNRSHTKLTCSTV